MALADALQTLLRLPGATYSCVVERDSGRVLAELGRGEAGAGDSEGVVPYSVPRWGTAVAAMFDSTSGDGLDDVMITGRRSYHLVRPLGPGAEVLVYLRLDRSRSNLAAARRELAAVRLAGGPGDADRTSPTRAREDAPPGSRSGASRSAAPPSSAAPASRAGGQPTPAAPASSLVPPATPARGQRRAPARTSGAGADTGAPASRRGASPQRGSAADRSSGSAQTRKPPRATATPSAPAALSALPTQSRPAGEAVRQIPLPRRAPGRSTPEATPPPGPRTRVRGAVATAAEPVPEGFAMPTVLGQRWAQDPGTLRRLLAGLRRMT
jgi:hypothetical protein